MNPFVKNILAILSPAERKRLFVLTAANMLTSVLDIASVAFILVTVRLYSNQGTSLPTAALPAWLTNRQSLLPALVLLLFFLGKNIAASIGFQKQYGFVYNVASRISQTNMLAYLQGGFGEQVDTDSAVYIRRISQLPVEFAHYILAGMQQIITEAMLVLLAAAGLLLYDAKLFILVVLSLLPVTLITWRYVKKKVQAVRGGIKRSNVEALQYLKEALAGFAESNVYGSNHFFTQRYAQKQQTLNNYLAKLQGIQGVPARMMEVFAVFGLVLLVATNKMAGGGTGIDMITVGAFVAAAWKIIPGIVRIVGLSGHTKAYRFTVDELKPKPLPMANDNNVMPQLTKVCFHNVSFSYGSKRVLHNINFSVHAGQMLGICAASGKGKTTIINLLLGFLQEGAGRICMNEETAGVADRKRYLKRIAYVKQQGFLMHSTIEKNITLSDDDATACKLQDAINVSGLASFVSRHAEGVNTLIAENGKNISGGQRQRIAIARALYKNADLVVLDEPFNELDNTSENELVTYFKQLAETGKMVILITHRRESLLQCHKIFTLDE